MTERDTFTVRLMFSVIRGSSSNPQKREEIFLVQSPLQMRDIMRILVNLYSLFSSPALASVTPIVQIQYSYGKRQLRYDILALHTHYEMLLIFRKRLSPRFLCVIRRHQSLVAIQMPLSAD